MTTTEATETVNLLFIWGEEEDDVWPVESGEEPHDPDYGIRGAVPADVWQAREAAFKAFRAADQAVLDACSTIDFELRRLAECCPRWSGYERPASVFWKVMIPASGDQETWPLLPHSIHHAHSEAEAQEVIDGWPDEFYVNYGARPVALVRKADLTIERGGWSGSTGNCHTCGWSREDHADAGEPA